jgi:hypothetical protein
VSLFAEIEKAIKLEKKHPIGRRYRVVNSLLSSKNMSSRPKTNKPKNASKTPILMYVESLRMAIMLNE